MHLTFGNIFFEKSLINIGVVLSVGVDLDISATKVLGIYQRVAAEERLNTRNSTKRRRKPSFALVFRVQVDLVEKKVIRLTWKTV